MENIRYINRIWHIKVLKNIGILIQQGGWGHWTIKLTFTHSCKTTTSYLIFLLIGSYVILPKQIILIILVYKGHVWFIIIGMYINLPSNVLSLNIPGIRPILASIRKNQRSVEQQDRHQKNQV